VRCDTRRARQSNPFQRGAESLSIVSTAVQGVLRQHGDDYVVASRAISSGPQARHSAWPTCILHSEKPLPCRSGSVDSPFVSCYDAGDIPVWLLMPHLRLPEDRHVELGKKLGSAAMDRHMGLGTGR